MEKPKFTKGPWKVSDVCGLAMYDNPKDYYQYIQKNDDVIGLVWGRVGDREANAVLMAAAPDMYEELHETARFLEASALWIEKIHGVIAISEAMKYNARNIDKLLAKVRGEVEK